MSRERLREGWQHAWQRFYAPRSIWKRWTVRPRSSWIQTLGYLPINILQNRLVRHKIVGGTQRFRSARGFDPMSHALTALSREAEAAESADAAGATPLKEPARLRVIQQ
jgi:hypothetical protein